MLASGEVFAIDVLFWGRSCAKEVGTGQFAEGTLGHLRNREEGQAALEARGKGGPKRTSVLKESGDPQFTGVRGVGAGQVCAGENNDDLLKARCYPSKKAVSVPGG
eukprot:CAMPEP_0114150036 /NCGR_PEP_ID=MMETSP0043_2-20121206/22485_1 /TAXON_ID=464988 /ORGANISM="Hemiselmis andersenii, Strain CCMP644" /LENGTH=105 /DNA_ID=CAMNT_0001244733 /DNA_START=1 /DNA_END=316 /DNA_ORIENTATION=+